MLSKLVLIFIVDNDSVIERYIKKTSVDFQFLLK